MEMETKPQSSVCHAGLSSLRGAFRSYVCEFVVCLMPQETELNSLEPSEPTRDLKSPCCALSICGIALDRTCHRSWSDSS